MKVEVISKEFEVTPAIQAHGEKATARLNKLKVEPSYNHMVLKKDGPYFVSEYEVKTKFGSFFSKGYDVDCYTSITSAATKLFEQLKKKLDKIHDHH